MWYVIKTQNGVQITNIHQHDFRNVLHRAWDYNLAQKFVWEMSERKKDRISTAIGIGALAFVMLAGGVNVG
jgi:glycogen synthase